MPLPFEFAAARAWHSTPSLKGTGNERDEKEGIDHDGMTQDRRLLCRELLLCARGKLDLICIAFL